VTVYADSSALLKLYVPERGHEQIRAITSTLVTAEISRVELASALWRKHRMGELDPSDAHTLTARFEADLDDPVGDIALVATNPSILDAALDMVARHGLRAYDAVQLASAVEARTQLGGLERFAAFDNDLRAAASAERFGLIPATLGWVSAQSRTGTASMAAAIASSGRS